MSIFRNVADVITQPVIEAGLDGIITYVNEAALEMLGYDRSEIVGKPHYAMLIPEERRNGKQRFAEKMETAQAVIDGEIQSSGSVVTKDNEYAFIKKDGSIANVILHAERVVSEGNTVGLRAFLTDISDKKIVEREMAQLDDDMPKISEENKAILGEIRTMLESDSQHLELLKKVKPGKISFGERIANNVSTWVGSWGFMAFLLSLILIWVSLHGGGPNSVFPSLFDKVDDYPFILLNLLLGTFAIFQAPIILMASNAQYRRDLDRDKHQYDVVLTVEGELRALYNKISTIGTNISIAMVELEFVQDSIKKRQEGIINGMERIYDSANECPARETYVMDMEGINKHLNNVEKMLEDIKQMTDHKKENENGRDQSGSTGNTPGDAN